MAGIPPPPDPKGSGPVLAGCEVTGVAAGPGAGSCPTISRMTVTLLTSQSAPTATDADALVTGLFQGTDGPALTLRTDETDLMAALTALGATGKAEEITKIPTGGRLGTPVVI